MKRPFRIGTRGSALALWQANYIKDLLSDSFPALNPEIYIIKTTGDRNLESPLSEIGGKGVFVKEIEESLLSEKIDIAVHSMKDLPAILPEGLAIGAVAERQDPRDVLISKRGLKLNELPEGSGVGTGSLRRAAQLLALRPDLRVLPIRGNVDTRLKKLKEGDEYDAIILAAAGVERMGLAGDITEKIPPDVMIPAPGQGIIAIECRENDTKSAGIISKINHHETSLAAVSERAFLKKLAGDCNVPAGCHARVDRGSVSMSGILASPDGRVMVREKLSGGIDNTALLGEKLADLILDKGGREILDSLSSP
ncbi:MAG: hydroxymethylbilane synthase [Deltaproteobacteria bacterium]